MKVTAITPDALDEMQAAGDDSGYVVYGEPTIYIDFSDDNPPRVYTMARSGDSVDFHHVKTTERLGMLLDAISATPTAQEAFDALFEKGGSK